MSRVLRLAIAGMLILSVASFASANCLAGSMRKIAETACPDDGQHDCCPSIKAGDCCTSSAASTERFVAGKPVSVDRIMALSFMPPTAPAVSSTRRLPSLSAAVSLASSPPLLLASSLRI